ncbi:HD family hydrolase, diverged [Treponema primitia ZAS-2]|uniref:HD family hydrolase, diverged n=1 Tax=Treponema primitia (strain ATCC BAA-887 / DSM 12427 / ZAS-2) TaxID=545694 RepID=F5YQJ1_TREPZ|nr:HD domain-containing protein [Treponema primitia]AEF86193.1 HD family hydrolase, diverged [Treponema primitia ZAS-2]
MKDIVLFGSIAKEILEHPVFSESKGFIQHGRISVYEHSLDVAKLSFSMGEFFKIADKESLVRGALLHDFFLYDWHKPEKMWSPHGWTHPVVAAENGRKYFNISDKEASIIRTHMWPYTLLHPPQYREGWIVCIADKICSALETLCRWRRSAV